MAKTAIEKKHSASYAQLLAMLTQVAGNIAFEKANVTNAYKALIGELGKTTGDNPVDHTVVSYIAEKIAGVTADATALEGRVKDAEDAIDLLNDGASVEGSVDYKITQAFNDFATKVSDDNVVNTFKEMIDYVAAHGTEYANLAALVGTLPSDAGVATVVAYAEKLAAAAQKEADDRIKAIEDDYLTSADKTELEGKVTAEKTRAEGAEKTLSDRLDIIEGEESQDGSIKKALKDAKDYADGLAGNYDENGAAAAVQGETENTVKDLEDAINGFSYLTDEEVNTIKALFPIA